MLKFILFVHLVHFVTITVQSTPTLQWKLSIGALKLQPIKNSKLTEHHICPKPKLRSGSTEKHLACVAASPHPALTPPDVKTSASESSVVKAIHTLWF